MIEPLDKIFSTFIFSCGKKMQLTGLGKLNVARKKTLILKLQ